MYIHFIFGMLACICFCVCVLSISNIPMSPTAKICIFFPIWCLICFSVLIAGDPDQLWGVWPGDSLWHPDYRRWGGSGRPHNHTTGVSIALSQLSLMYSKLCKFQLEACAQLYDPLLYPPVIRGCESTCKLALVVPGWVVVCGYTGWINPIKWRF